MNKDNYYMKRLPDFLCRLSQNNDRPWFQKHKTEFDELRAGFIADLDRLGNLIGQVDPSLAGITGRDAAYRIYRDTRFTPDKTPYKTFFSASFTRGGRNVKRAGYYLHVNPLSPSDSGVYAGVWCPPSDMLKKLRTAIVDNFEELDEIMKGVEQAGNYELLSSSQLKTAPQGWAKDHPQIKWLRMKDYGLWHSVENESWFQSDWVERVAKHCSVMKPFVDFLNYSIDE